LYCVTFHCVLCYWFKSSDLPEVDFSTFSCQRRKIYGASSFSERKIHPILKGRKCRRKWFQDFRR
jgi:hypothetical protein